MAEWRFRKMARGEIRSDPVEGEFFMPEGLAEALVRESVQNSLDAKEGGTVRVRYGYPGVTGALRAPNSARYLNGLDRHVARSILDGENIICQPLTYITVEDFGTRGLTGDPNQDRDSDAPSHEKNFYYFWRNIGRSGKSDTDRGRWGLGKTVFPATSRINSFFGLSYTSTGTPTLMGQSVLRTHEIGGDLYCPYGYYAEFEEQHGFAIPLVDSQSISQFKADFRLSRRDEPGVSIVIPFPQGEDLTHDDVVRFAIRHYFYPILAGELVLEFAWSGRSTVLDRDTLRGVAMRIDWTNDDMTPAALAATLDLASWAIHLADSSFVSLPPVGEHGAPRWEISLLEPSLLSNLRARFERNERIAIRLTIGIELARPRDRILSYFDVFLERDARLSRGEDYYIRQGLTISGIRNLKERKVRGFVVVQDSGLSTLLGDTENPAHTEWQDRSGRLSERYVLGPSRLRFVKKSLSNIVDVLSRPPSGLEERLLEDIFSIELPPEEAEPAIRPRGAEDEPGIEPEAPPEIDVETAVRAYRIQQTSGGFRVVGNPDAPEAVLVLTIVAAYEVRKGNPFKKYEPFDFKFNTAPIRIEARNAEVDVEADNRLRLTAASNDFEVMVTGFDARRDLCVRAVRGGAEP